MKQKFTECEGEYGSHEVHSLFYFSLEIHLKSFPNARRCDKLELLLTSSFSLSDNNRNARIEILFINETAR